MEHIMPPKIKTYDIKVSKLQSIYSVFKDQENLYDAWGGEVTPGEVRYCIEKNTLESTPFQLADGDDYDHAARIAYLVVHPNNNVIEIEVGYHTQCLITDGNHRFAAAIIRGDETISVSWSGEEKYFKHLFIRKNKRYE